MVIATNFPSKKSCKPRLSLSILEAFVKPSSNVCYPSIESQAFLPSSPFLVAITMYYYNEYAV